MRSRTRSSRLSTLPRASSARPSPVRRRPFPGYFLGEPRVVEFGEHDPDRPALDRVPTPGHELDEPDAADGLLVADKPEEVVRATGQVNGHTRSCSPVHDLYCRRTGSKPVAGGKVPSVVLTIATPVETAPGARFRLARPPVRTASPVPLDRSRDIEHPLEHAGDAGRERVGPGGRRYLKTDRRSPDATAREADRQLADGVERGRVPEGFADGHRLGNRAEFGRDQWGSRRDQRVDALKRVADLATEPATGRPRPRVERAPVSVEESSSEVDRPPDVIRRGQPVLAEVTNRVTPGIRVPRTASDEATVERQHVGELYDGLHVVHERRGVGCGERNCLDRVVTRCRDGRNGAANDRFDEGRRGVHELLHDPDRAVGRRRPDRRCEIDSVGGRRVDRRGIVRVGTCDGFDDLALADCGDAPIFPMDRAKTAESIAAHVAMIADRAFPVLLGGDHYSTFPAFHGFAEGSDHDMIGLVWIDAHTDTVAESALFGEHFHGSSTNLIAESSCTDFEHVSQVAIRGYESPDFFEFADESGLSLFASHDVRERGIREVVPAAIDDAAADTDAVYVTFDVDAVDPGVAAGTGTPVPGGLAAKEAVATMEVLGGHDAVGAADLMEVAPRYDTTEGTSRLAAYLLVTLLERQFAE